MEYNIITPSRETQAPGKSTHVEEASLSEAERTSLQVFVTRLGEGIADDTSPFSSSEINPPRQEQIEKLKIEVALYTFAVEEGLRMIGTYKITQRTPNLLRYMRITRKLDEKKLAEKRRQLKALINKANVISVKGS